MQLSGYFILSLSLSLSISFSLGDEIELHFIAFCICILHWVLCGVCLHYTPIMCILLAVATMATAATVAAGATATATAKRHYLNKDHGCLQHLYRWQINSGAHRI